MQNAIQTAHFKHNFGILQRIYKITSENSGIKIAINNYEILKFTKKGLAMKKNNEIWLLLDSRSNGGIETHIFQLATGLQQNNMEVKVIFLDNHGPHPLRDELNIQGIKNESLDGKISTLRRKLKSNSPKILHTHGYKAGIIGRILSKFSGIPVVSTYHSGDKGSGKLYFYGVIDRLTSCLSDKNYAVSQDISKSLIVHSEILNNFIDMDNINISRGSRIAYVGRISEEKGPDIFTNLAKQLTDTDFYLYGDGPIFNSLQRSKSSNTHFLGEKSNMASYWDDISLLVMPSRQEGLPLAAIEAMARGIPVLASDVGQLGQLICHKSNGWLVNVGDINNLVRHIREWLVMPTHERNKMRNAARQKVKGEFSSTVVIPSIIHSYNQIA